MAYIIAEPCIGTKDTACVDVCPVDCIHPAKGRTYDDGRPTYDEVPQLYIDPSECIDCGACVPVCPVTAIFAQEDLPEKWQAYIGINKNYVDGGKFQPDNIKNLAANPILTKDSVSTIIPAMCVVSLKTVPMSGTAAWAHIWPRLGEKRDRIGGLRGVSIQECV